MVAVIKAKLKESDGELAIMSLVYIGICKAEDMMLNKHVLIQCEDGNMLISKLCVSDNTYQDIIEEAFNKDKVDLTILGEFEYVEDNKYKIL